MLTLIYRFKSTNNKGQKSSHEVECWIENNCELMEVTRRILVRKGEKTGIKGWKVVRRGVGYKLLEMTTVHMAESIRTLSRIADKAFIQLLMIEKEEQL